MKEGIKLGDMQVLWSDLAKLTKIGEWKRRVKQFADKFKLSDIEAINIANKKFTDR